MKRLSVILAMVVIATMATVVSKAQSYQPQQAQLQGTPLAINAVSLAPIISDSANVVVVQIVPHTVVANDSSYVSSLSIRWILGYVPKTGKGRSVLSSPLNVATLPNTATLSDIKTRIRSCYPTGFITFK